MHGRLLGCSHWSSWSLLLLLLLLLPLQGAAAVHWPGAERLCLVLGDVRPTLRLLWRRRSHQGLVAVLQPEVRLRAPLLPLLLLQSHALWRGGAWKRLLLLLLLPQTHWRVWTWGRRRRGWVLLGRGLHRCWCVGWPPTAPGGGGSGPQAEQRQGAQQLRVVALLLLLLLRLLRWRVLMPAMALRLPLQRRLPRPGQQRQ